MGAALRGQLSGLDANREVTNSTVADDDPADQNGRSRIRDR
jgi:hypothetical protein